jgi:flagellar motor switch protein FliG
MYDRQKTIRKAAILITSLDGPTADQLLAELAPDQAATLRRAVTELGTIEPEEQTRVIDEFFRIGPMQPAVPAASIEPNGHSTEHVCDPSGQNCESNQRENETSRSNEAPFQSLRELSGTSLATKLRHEHPQMIAVVVSHLPPQNAADLLTNLSPSLQAEVARRLVDLEDADPEILLEIERGLTAWLDEHERSSRRRSAGMIALESIFAAADPFAQQSLLANLARHDRRLASQLAASGNRDFSFDELHELDDASLSKVFLHSDQHELAVALAGAGKALVARALRVLPVARAARLRRDLDQVVPRKTCDVQAAQQTIASVASDLDRRGEICNAIGRKLSLAV